MTILDSKHEHCLSVDASGANPVTGNVYVAAILKEGGIKQHLFVFRVKMDNTVELVKVVKGGGGADAYAQSQIAPGGVSIRPNGSLIVTFSCIPKGDTSGRFKPVFEPVVGVDTGWTWGAAGPVPVPVTIVVDQSARDAANLAMARAVSAENLVAGAKSVAGEALRIAQAANTRPFPVVPTEGQIADIAWGKAVDYTGTPAFVSLVKSIAQNVLVEAIEYAKSATALQSRLRALIESIVGK